MHPVGFAALVVVDDKARVALSVLLSILTLVIDSQLVEA